MPVTGKIQITGGLYQNFEGSPLANGYLIVQLSHDEQESVDPGLVTGMPKIKISLDSNGNIPVSPATMIWPNDQLLPSGSQYGVWGYASDGTFVFGPQFWTLTSAVSPYNVANQLPSNPPGNGAGSGSSSLILETNGTQNSNQALLNIAQGTGVTITNVSGTTTISSTGASFSTSGQGYFIGAGVKDFAAVTGSVTGNFLVNSNNQVIVHQFILESSWTISNCSYEFSGSGSGGEKANFGIYNAAKSKLIDAAFDASITTLQTISFTGVVLPAGVYYFAQADSIGGGAHGPMSNPSGNSDASQLLAGINAVSPLIATCSNALSGATLPATLGTLTAVTTGNYTGMGLAVWKP